MTLANLRLVEGTFMNNTHALDAAVPQIERAFRKRLDRTARKSESTGRGMAEAIEPEAELFAVVEQVDLAEKAFHDAIARRNEAQIAYLREPCIMTREALRGGKNSRGSRAGNPERGGPLAGQHSGYVSHRAQAEGVIRLHGRQARRQHPRRHLAAISLSLMEAELDSDKPKIISAGS